MKFKANLKTYLKYDVKIKKLSQHIKWEYIVNNFYTNVVYKLFTLKYFNKKRAVIRNSYKSNSLIKNFFRNSLDYKTVCKIFYKKNIFVFSRSEEKDKIIEALNKFCSNNTFEYKYYADKILKNEFSVFERNFSFKEDINWHNSFFDDFNWNLSKSEKIEIHPKNEEIDVKYVWEFNRHQYLIYLGIVYYLTKKEIYAKKFENIIFSWIKRNPPLYGINWYSGLEISLRLTSWIFCLYFFKDSKIINNAKFFKVIFKSMFHHAYFLKIFYDRRRLNHTIGDIFGICLFSKIFEDIKPLNKWKQKFFKKFRKQILLQIRDDGTNIEQSVNYHRHILEFFTLFMIINPSVLNTREKFLIEKMYDYLLYIIKPNRDFPLIGDFDDGKILPLTYYEKNPFNHILNLGSIIFKRYDLKFLSKTISPISILLLGEDGINNFNNLKISEPNKNFVYFEKAGYVINRNNWSREANYLFLDLAKFGALGGGHNHSSITSFVFCFKGKDIILDSGTYTYSKSWKKRNLFRGALAHNVLTIDRKDQSIVKDWFGWQISPKIKRIVKNTNGEIVVTCYHNGFFGFIVKRMFRINQNLNQLTITDTVLPRSNMIENKFHDIDVYFHFNKDINLELKGNEILINNIIALRIHSIQKLNISLVKTNYSPNYGFLYENKTVKVHLTYPFKNNENLEIISEFNSLNN